jgi:hypothetical protein
MLSTIFMKFIDNSVEFSVHASSHMLQLQHQLTDSDSIR